MMFIDENETSHRYVEPKHEYIFRATLLIIGYLFYPEYYMMIIKMVVNGLNISL
jgi:hypothetical protein